MDLATAALVAVAGFAAGAVNAVAGGGTLIAFPVVMAAGNSALVANMTTGTGLLTGYAGGSLAYRAELGGQRARVRSLAAVALVGAVIGALILLRTPSDTFRTVVPYLVLLSCALLAAQPAVARLVACHSAEVSQPKELSVAAQVAVLLGAVYGAYFGAGLGVILLAILGFVLDDSLHRLNALKGVLAFIINLAGGERLRRLWRRRLEHRRHPRRHRRARRPHRCVVGPQAPRADTALAGHRLRFGILDRAHRPRLSPVPLIP